MCSGEFPNGEEMMSIILENSLYPDFINNIFIIVILVSTEGWGGKG